LFVRIVSCSAVVVSVAHLERSDALAARLAQKQPGITRTAVSFIGSITAVVNAVANPPNGQIAPVAVGAAERVDWADGWTVPGRSNGTRSLCRPLGAADFVRVVSAVVLAVADKQLVDTRQTTPAAEACRWAPDYCRLAVLLIGPVWAVRVAVADPVGL